MSSPEDTVFGAVKSLHVARVVQYHAGFNFYTVVLGEGGQHRKAVANGAPAGIGASEHHIYPPGTLLVVADAVGTLGEGSRSEYFLILGAISGVTVNQALSTSDVHDLLSGAGYLFDKVHSFLTNERTDDIAPVSAGAGVPVDALSGDRGVCSPLGPGWLVGLAMAYLRASERCGIWMFRLDEHLRSVAKSMEQQTLAREVLDLYDDGELSVIERVAFVPWEAMGAFENGVPTGKKSEGVEFSDPKAAPTDYPVNAVQFDQRSVFRLFSLRGYLGDIKDEFVVLPVGASGLDGYNQDQDLLGERTENKQAVFRQSTGADGTFVLQSAKGIHLEKYPLIQLPVDTTTPDDPAGDNPTNYKASGVFGSGDAQTRKDYQPDDNGCPGDRGILGLAHHGAFISKASLQTLRSHKKDWRVQDESKTPFASKLTKGTYVSDSGYKVSPNSMWMGLPRSVDLPVQKGRWESVRYYAGRSAIDMWDDGSVVIEDAWGSQIIMAGGNIVLTCPGDIIMAPGRSAITMAPQDIVQRAGNSVDITATRRDVTIKAEVNLKVIGGNNGADGGVLVESKATRTGFDYTKDGESTRVSGLVLKSSGDTAVVGKGVSVIAKETLGLQAGGIKGISDTVTFDAVTQFAVVLGDSSKKDTGVINGLTSYIFSPTACVLGKGGTPSIFAFGSLYALGSMVVAGPLQAENSITSVGLVTAYGGVAAPGDIIPLNRNSGGGVRAAMQSEVGNAVTQIADPAVILTGQARTAFALLTSMTSSYFNPVAVESYVKGSLRTPKDYRTEQGPGFILAQWRWQQYKPEGSTTWSENAVKGTSGDTLPWPGTAWTQPGRYLVYDISGVFDATKGMSTDGGAGTAPVVHPVDAASGYLVNSTET